MGDGQAMWALAIILGLVGVALGYFATKSKHAAKISELSTQLDQARLSLEQATNQSAALQNETKQLSNDLQQREIAVTKLNANLEASTATEKRLEAELASRTHELEVSNGKLLAEIHAHGETGKKLESANTDVRAQSEQINDLRGRLTNTESILAGEREQINKLKDDLAQEGKKAKELDASNFDAREQLKEVKQALLGLQAQYTLLQNQYQSLSNEHTEQKTTLEQKELHFKEQMQQLSDAKQSLTKEFENLANKIFDEKGKTFTETSKSSIDSLLKPFREQIDGFQQRANQIHEASLQNTTSLNAEIKKVLDVGLKMQDEANNLVTALKGDKKVQGTWSEVQAEILLEMSGLQKGREYERESSHKNDEGNVQRPDFIVRLPNSKHIIVDSKISLNAYVQSVAAETVEERELMLKAHVDAIRKHVADLSAKNYPKLKSLNTPEFVFMFMGNEPAYLAALNADPTLAQSAYHKGIAIVTPNTLLSSLRIVSHLWSIDKQNANTRELAEHASKVYDKLRIFVEKMEKLGSQLNTVNKSYEDSWKTLKDGSGSLTKQVAKFVEMGVSVKEKLPASVTEQSDMDLLETGDAISTLLT